MAKTGMPASAFSPSPSWWLPSAMPAIPRMAVPILCTADVFAVYYWRKHAAASRLFSLTPWVWWASRSAR